MNERKKPAPRFRFYEVVRVRATPRAISNGIASLEGAVMGMAADETSGRVSYAVLLDALDETWDVQESDLEPTGRFRKREDYYDGTSIRVSERGEPRSS